jgi:hypothetical protein
MKWTNENYGTVVCICAVCFVVFLGVVTIHDMKVNRGAVVEECIRGKYEIVKNVNTYIYESQAAVNSLARRFNSHSHFPFLRTRPDARMFRGEYNITDKEVPGRVETYNEGNPFTHPEPVNPYQAYHTQKNEGLL